MSPMNKTAIPRSWKAALGILLVLALVLFPVFFGNAYFIHVLIVIGMYTVLAYGLDLVLG